MPGEKYLKTLITREDITRFFDYLIKDEKANFHPDDNFETYIQLSTGKPSFEKSKAQALNARMQEAKKIAGQDIYALAQASTDKNYSVIKSIGNNINMKPRTMFADGGKMSVTDAVALHNINQWFSSLPEPALLKVTKCSDSDSAKRLWKKMPLSIKEDIYSEFKNEFPMFADGGNLNSKKMEKERVKVFITGYPWWLQKIDHTHLYLSNNEESKGHPTHIGQLYKRDTRTSNQFYTDVEQWLAGKLNIEDKQYGEFERGGAFEYANGGAAEKVKKPKLEDFVFPNDVTGEKAYAAYRVAKNEYIKSKLETFEKIWGNKKAYKPYDPVYEAEKPGALDFVPEEDRWMEKGGEALPLITEADYNKLVAKGAEVSNYTGFTVKINGTTYRLAHKFSFSKGGKISFDELSGNEKQLLEILKKKNNAIIETIERQSSREYDIVYSGTYSPSGIPYNFRAWLPLAAIKDLVEWNTEVVAEMSDYPSMVLHSDWSGIRDTNRESLWNIFETFAVRKKEKGGEVHEQGELVHPFFLKKIILQYNEVEDYSAAYKQLEKDGYNVAVVQGLELALMVKGSEIGSISISKKGTFDKTYNLFNGKYVGSRKIATSDSAEMNNVSMESQIIPEFTGADVTWDGKRCKAEEFRSRAKIGIAYKPFLKVTEAELNRIKNLPLINHKTLTDIDNPEKYEWYEVGEDKYGRSMYCPKTGLRRSTTMGEFYQNSTVD